MKQNECDGLWRSLYSSLLSHDFTNTSVGSLDEESSLFLFSVSLNDLYRFKFISNFFLHIYVRFSKEYLFISVGLKTLLEDQMT